MVVMTAGSGKRRPVVGIEPAIRAGGGKPVLEMSTSYSDAVYHAGGMPMLLAAPQSAEVGAGDLLDTIDALLFTGGPDFHTERLGLGPVHPEARLGPAAKQDFDVALAKGALERDMAILGICYGMQLLGILAGAGLLQHLPEDRPDARVRHSDRSGQLKVVRHAVTVKPGSLVSKALGCAGSLMCHSAHHQAITAPERGWEVSAQDDDGLVEAIESTRHHFAIGVQWHPEREEQGKTPHAGLFRALVEAARTPGR